MTVKRILEKLGLQNYASNFAEEKIDYATFLSLNADHLREMELPLGVRIKILNEIKHLKENGEFTGGIKLTFT